MDIKTIAAQILSGLVANPNNSQLSIEKTVALAITYADTLLRELEK